MQGVFFDGVSSRAHDATLEHGGDALVLKVGEAEARVPVQSVRIEPPLGSLRRVLYLPGGGRFETGDLAGVSALEGRMNANRGLRWVQLLEARWRTVLVSLVLLGVGVFAFLRFGLPALAGVAARITPVSALRVMDTQTLKLLDREYLKPSTLSAATQERLETEFGALAREQGHGGYDYHLAFRDGGKVIGSNAFALPNGTVVVTDGLVRLAKSDREIMGVLAHEVGHVEHRHSAQSVYQGAGLLLFASLVTGDLTSATTVGGTVVLLLARTGYSRNMEAQSDADAGRYLMRHGGTTAPLRDLLTRLTKEVGGHDLGLLNTHPGLQDRLKQLKGMEKK